MTITADNNYGGVTSQTFQLVVNNVAPTASFANQTGEVTVGGSGVLAFINPVDPGTSDMGAGFTYSFDCTGDGVYEETNSTATSYTCAYNQLGNFNSLGVSRIGPARTLITRSLSTSFRLYHSRT